MNNAVAEPVVATAEPTNDSILGQVIVAAKQSTKDQMVPLLKTFVAKVNDGYLKWDRNLLITINAAIQRIDEILSQQLTAILHAPEVKKLEGTWKGLHYLTMNSETGESLKLKVLNATKNEIFKDLDKAVEFDQSQLFKKIYENEFGTPGGEPYGALIGDYYFDSSANDIDLLSKMSGVAAASFCPFISAVSPHLFGFDNWTELSKPRDLEKIFQSADYTKWRSLRESEDSRFVTLVLPRVLARLPYGTTGVPIEEFNFEESPLDASNRNEELAHEDYCWMNAAYVHGAVLTRAYAQFGWCTAIRGAEGGGKIENLPTFTFTTDEGDLDSQCPSEIGITDRREAELSKLGFLPLCHYKNTDYSVFFGAQTVQKPKKYDRPEATANAAISARLPYMMATSRFAHYLKIMGRDKIGSFMEASDVESWLNRWILNYINGNADSGQEMKAKYPLAEAKITVNEIPGMPGSYHAVAWLRPWLQMEELTASLRLVARIPKMG